MSRRPQPQRRTIPPWLRLGQSIWSDEKLLNVSHEARWLYVAGMAYSAQQLLDGAVPEPLWPMLGGRPKDGAELIQADLWVPPTCRPDTAGVHPGIAYDKWDRWQEARWRVLEERERGKAASRESREKKDAAFAERSPNTPRTFGTRTEQNRPDAENP